MNKISVFDLEKHMINPEKWEEVLDKFPKDIREDLEYIIRWGRGEEKYMPHPMGIGHHPECGWFCLASGQGPFIIWTEKENKSENTAWFCK